MRRSIFVFLMCFMFGPLAMLRAATVKRQTSSTSHTSSTSKTSKSAHPAATKASTTKRRRRRRTSSRFVPRQKAPTPERISEIQTALSHGGYYQGDPNGKWDANTIAALEKFQSANGIEPSGKLDAPSLQKLGLGSDIAGVSAPRPPAPVESVPETPTNPKPAGSSPSSPSGSADSPGSAPHAAASINPAAGSLAAKPPQQ